jgi:hypothetical protein
MIEQKGEWEKGETKTAPLITGSCFPFSPTFPFLPFFQSTVVNRTIGNP